MDFNSSQTRPNLLRAFAGESQAIMRYTISGEIAKKQGLYVVYALFKYTADQERAHAQIFWDHLANSDKNNIDIDANYPANVTNDVLALLEDAAHNEHEEFSSAYPAFANVAKEEGFLSVENSFNQIAKIEQEHGKRFEELAKLLKENKLFVSDIETDWICLNCGHRFKGKQVPEKCPVCSHDKGYFIRLSLSPFEK